jgi:hypothetical protein
MFLLSACGSVPVETYRDVEPKISFRDYFTGPVTAWGIVQDRKGKVIRRFEIDMLGTWQGERGTLEENFRYYDGEIAKRIWNVKQSGDGTFIATADDIIGDGLGKISGNAALWRYTMKVKVKEKFYHIDFDDWMFQMNDGVVINRSYMKKFGIRVGEITIVMKKQ